MQGLYNINENTKTATTAKTWIHPGIHENLKLIDVKYDVSKNGKEFLAFYVENEKGDPVSCTEWPYNPKKPFEQMDAIEKETAVSIIESQKSKVKQIVEVFKPNFNITADSFKDFAEKTIAFLGDSYKNTPIRLKVVYDKRGWTTFGQSARATFIENMSIAKTDSRIIILENDRLLRPEQPMANSKEVNPINSIVETKAVPVDDLPF